jgi:hypothetical protein
VILQVFAHAERFVIDSQKCGFVNTAIFKMWAGVLFFPHVLQARHELSYEGTAYLLLDGCSAHFSDYFSERCSFYGVELIISPPHSSDETQSLTW